MKRKITKALSVLSLMLIICSQNPLFASVITSTQSGFFSASSTWVGGTAPGPGDDIVIATGDTVTLDMNAQVKNITIQVGAILVNSTFDVIGSSTIPGAIIDYINNGTHNGTGKFVLYEGGRTRLQGNGITNCNIEYRNYGLEILSACNLTINGNIQPGTGADAPGILEAQEGGGGNLTINGDIITNSIRGGIIYNQSGTIIVNGNVILLAGEGGTGGQLTNGAIATFIITGNLTLGSFSSMCENFGNITIGGDVLGAYDTYFIQEVNSTVKFGGSVFPNNEGLLYSVSSPILGPSEPNTIEYNGTATQNIALPTDGAYSNMVINNTSSAGVTLNSDISINGELTLTNGLVNLGANNLILSGTSAILGTPSATNMVVATGTGELRKAIASTGSFTFPVGDNDAPAGYSPVTLNFTAGSFAGEYVGVNLQNSAYPGVTGSYLNRNWTVTSAPGFPGFACIATFNYVVPADVTGAESEIYCFRAAPTIDFYAAANTSLHQLTASGLTSFGTFTGKEATTAWTGAIGSDWFTAGNWSDGIPGTITQVTIPGGLTNYPTLLSSTTISGITINEGGSFIGSEFLTTSSALVKRDITNTNFHLIASPVTSITSGSVFPLNQTEVWVREYNETTGDWNNLTTAGFLTAGKGYSVQMNQPQTAMFAGVLNSSPVTSTLAKLNPGVDINRIGWNLLGNPFASAIDWDLTDHSAIDGSVYVWNGTNFVSWNGAVGALTNGIIPAENGFFTKTAVNGATLTIPLAARVHSGIGFYKSSVANLLELTAEGNSFTDKTFIHFNDQASSGFDNQYDAYKLFGNENAPQLYSMITGDILSINELPMAGNEIVNLGFKCNTTGTYSISASGIENFSSNVPVFLQDLKLNVSQDMKANPVYTFSYVAGENENRFRLNFADVTGLSEAVNTGIRVFSFNKTVVIENTSLLKGNISIFDITGRKLFSQKLTGQARTNLPLQVVSGTYIVKVVSANGAVTTKVHIQ